MVLVAFPAQRRRLPLLAFWRVDYLYAHRREGLAQPVCGREVPGGTGLIARGQELGRTVR